jgi:hypothetical protein
MIGWSSVQFGPGNLHLRGLADRALLSDVWIDHTIDDLYSPLPQI